MAMSLANRLSAFLAVAALVSGGTGAWEPNLETPPEIADGMPRAHTPRSPLSSRGHVDDRHDGVPCDSWQFGVETNSLREWATIPARCVGHVGNYMMGSHYQTDSRVVVDEAIAYAEGLHLSGQGKEVWVFDVDETTISNLPYYSKHGFGAEPYDWTKFAEYLKEARSPALPETLRLYRRLQALGIKPVILTGRRDDKQEFTAKNLASVGYTGYEKLVHRAQDSKVRPGEFKASERRKLEDAGYVIVGNMGDQWSDLLRAPEGARTFKLPNPMYYSA